MEETPAQQSVVNVPQLGLGSLCLSYCLQEPKRQGGVGDTTYKPAASP